MGDWTKLTASDGNVLDAYVATPAKAPVGSVVVIQEIFGVNPSIQAVADSYAADGFLAIAPATFDRFEPGLQLGYEGDDLKKAYELYGQKQPEKQLLDVAAAFEHVKKAGKGIGVVGFCYGGLLSWLSATRGEDLRMRPDCCVCYYPGGVGGVAAEEPSCPVMMHFGADDDHIGADQVDAVRKAHPEVELYLYDGVGHAFANAARASYNEGAARIARERTLKFLKTHIS